MLHPEDVHDIVLDEAAIPKLASDCPRDGLGATVAGVLGCSAALWAAAVGTLATWRHDQFLSHRFDLGNMVQAVWSTTQGRPLQMTDGATGEQITRLAAHVDPILVLLAPLWVIFPAPEMLLYVQATALAAGTYPAARLALAYSGSRVVATLAGLWYLAYPWTLWIALDEFHPVALAVPLLLYAIWFLDGERYVLFAVAGGLAMLTGELVGLTVAALGLWVFLRGHRAAGAVVAAAGAGWTAVCLNVIVPAFNDGAESRYYERFEAVGGSPSGLLRALVANPTAVLDQLTQGSDYSYVALLLLPATFLSVLTPTLLVAAAPQLLVNLLDGRIPVPLFHHVAVTIPVIIASAIVGLRLFRPRARLVALAAALVTSCLILAVHPPVPGSQVFVFPEQYSAARRAALREAVRHVPEGVPVTATNRLGAHLSTRRVIHLFPHTDGADWAVVDTGNPWWPGSGEPNTNSRPFDAAIRDLDRDRRWRLVFESEGVRVYARVS